MVNRKSEAECVCAITSTARVSLDQGGKVLSGHATYEEEINEDSDPNEIGWTKPIRSRPGRAGLSCLWYWVVVLQTKGTPFFHWYLALFSCPENEAL